MIRTTLFALMATSLSLAACSDDEPACPVGDPAITSFTIDPTSAAPGEDVTGTLVVANFELGGSNHAHSFPQYEPLHEGEEASTCPGGHVHVYLDDVISNPLIMTVDHTFAITIPDDTSEGDHTLIARLQNHDHTIIEPQITAEATITVTAP